jgi:hypothetical protein
MTTDDAARTWFRSPRLPIDDAYSAWFNAHSRCTRALRAWNAAAPAARAAAYHAYLAELRLEEAAADTLARFQARVAA